MLAACLLLTLREPFLAVQVVAYNTVIDLLGKMGRWEEALQMYQRMRREVSLCAVLA